MPGGTCTSSRRAVIKIHIVDGNTCMSDAIRVKTQDEIHCLRMAGAIAEAAHWEVCQALRPGMSELEIAGIAANACYKLCGMHRRTIRLRRAQHAHRQALEAR